MYKLKGKKPELSYNLIIKYDSVYGWFWAHSSGTSW